MKFLLCVLLSFFLASGMVLAQKNYKPGYIVTLKGDTILGGINYSGMDDKNQKFEFISSGNSQKQIFTAKKILSVAVNNGASYKRFAGKITRDIIRENSYINDRDTSFIIDTVFVKLMTGGKNMCLYDYTDDLKTRFYYTENKDDTPIELGYRVYYDPRHVDPIRGIGRTVHENIYLKQIFAIALKHDLLDNSFQRLLQDARYDKAYLIPIVKRLNKDK